MISTIPYTPTTPYSYVACVQHTYCLNSWFGIAFVIFVFFFFSFSLNCISKPELVFLFPVCIFLLFSQLYCVERAFLFDAQTDSHKTRSLWLYSLVRDNNKLYGDRLLPDPMDFHVRILIFCHFCHLQQLLRSHLMLNGHIIHVHACVNPLCCGSGWGNSTPIAVQNKKY